jgi:cystine transport system permease protein
MAEELFIEFYRGKDEQAFLDGWKTKYGEPSEGEIDEIYAAVADEIHRQVKEGQHELGDTFEYKGVVVGKSDYNEFHYLYLFEQE